MVRNPDKMATVWLLLSRHITTKVRKGRERERQRGREGGRERDKGREGGKEREKEREGEREKGRF